MALREGKSKKQQAGSRKAAETQKAAGVVDKRAKATTKKKIVAEPATKKSGRVPIRAGYKG